MFIHCYTVFVFLPTFSAVIVFDSTILEKTDEQLLSFGTVSKNVLGAAPTIGSILDTVVGSSWVPLFWHFDIKLLLCRKRETVQDEDVCYTSFLNLQTIVNIDLYITFPCYPCWSTTPYFLIFLKFYTKDDNLFVVIYMILQFSVYLSVFYMQLCCSFNSSFFYILINV